ncbi:MAG TPA: response regulator transcription factor [Acidimicrobiales bacterium]|nr:response regulator transcription factor [Acidimicrobiales bacterium]
MSGERPRSTPLVLVVEDEEDVRALIVRTLVIDGCRVAEAASAAEARAQLSKDTPDVVVLDLGLPDSSGLDLLRKLVSISVPVVVVTGRGGGIDRVHGLELGAADYMVKPFFTQELVIRVRRAADRAHSSSSLTLHGGGLAIDTDSREVLVEGRPVALTDREFDLLAYMASRPRTVFSRDDLLRDVWQSSADWQSSATVTEHIHRLRSKLEADPSQPTLIVTVGKSGYRFDPRHD